MIYPNDIPNNNETVKVKNPEGNWDSGYIVNGVWYIGVDYNPEDIVCPYSVSEWKYFE